MKTLSSFILLISAIGVLMFSMRSLSDALSDSVSNNLIAKIQRFTRGKTRAILFGVGGSFCLQSSSAFTLLLCGLVAGGIISDGYLFPIIMGANIGSTLTVFFVSLPIADIISLGVPVFFLLSLKSNKYKNLFTVLFYVSMIFFSFCVIRFASQQTSEIFIKLLKGIKYDFTFFLLGIILTAVMQSSSLVTSLFLCLYAADPINIDFISIAYTVVGINLGTCTTALLGSITSNKAARKCSLMHLFFNFIGSILFLTMTSFTVFSDFINVFFARRFDPEMRVAMFHLIYNLSLTLILLPFCPLITQIFAGSFHFKRRVAKVNS